MSPRQIILSLLATLFLISGLTAQEKKKPITLPDGVPEKVGKVLAYVDENNKAMEGYEGGATSATSNACSRRKTTKDGRFAIASGT